MEAQPIPVALVDDHTLFRSMMADMLEGIPQYKVVLEAGHGVDYMRAVRNGTEIAVAVVDLHMPMMDGYETIAWIRANTPGTRALALTFENSEEAAERALRAGACGFLRKDISKNTFLDALNQVAVLGHYRDPSEVRQAQALRKEHEQRRGVALSSLTERELAFIRLVCDEHELTNEQVAEHMGVHRRTVDGYRESVYSKCDVKTKAGLVVFAFKWGILP
ncbi:MAG TPA: response regulator transcription factor [Flavobacteriales bacterium]|nr:response regulator transcription factor [Flavobacteriales bacterium]